MMIMKTPPIDLPERYQPTGGIFAGGHGEVFICNDSYLDRVVAIKFARYDSEQDDLISEAKAQASIESKHVVRIFDLITSDYSDQVGIVMEYLPGSDLHSECFRNDDEFLKKLYQIACGLSDIHARGLIHRDVKPKNMKYSSSGILKIYDFGISSQSEYVQTDGGKGTNVYRGPEYYGVQPINLSQAADVYSFGVSMWWLIANSFPIELKTMPPTLPKSFATIKNDLPSKVITVLDKCFSPDPDKRPTMHDIKDVVVSEIVYGKHTGRFTLDGTSHEIRHSVGKQVKVGGFYNSIVVKYDGYHFEIVEVSGNVYLNGHTATVGSILPKSCVLEVGKAQFVTFDMSNPEVVI